MRLLGTSQPRRLGIGAQNAFCSPITNR